MNTDTLTKEEKKAKLIQERKKLDDIRAGRIYCEINPIFDMYISISYGNYFKSKWHHIDVMNLF